MRVSAALGLFGGLVFFGSQLAVSPVAAATQKTTAAKPVAAPSVSDLTGTWTGLFAEVGRTKQHPITITLKGKTGTSSYPDQHCAGKLARVGTAGDYAYFTETITDGKFNPADNTGCLDGGMTIVRSGQALVMSWVADHNGQPVVAYGSLAPQQ